ncbi:fatty acid desaturase [Alicyclobacillus tolerans]|uniref:fatty acid desaturase n=1 Tax=Alicyclobacillus tolerans TaxID=90970 RepID=UPI001F358DC6|nr:fatty acid desaturase [Alicyclobacillus tolerans]MCF8564185.1 fatty acid desaturase [Alicyclobacillus tolerans]
MFLLKWERELTAINLNEDPQYWKTALEAYQNPSIRKSWWQLINTIVPLAILWSSAYFCFSISVWLTLLLTIPAAGFLVRTFIIFHDCSHHSFFKSRRANDLVGIFTGLLAFFPYHQWKYEHNVHHAGNGNLSRRGMGDITTLTVDEYFKLSLGKRLLYRMYRHPIVMFGLGPIYVVFIKYRFNRKGAGPRERFNTYFTNGVLVGITALGCWGLGWEQFLLVEGPILYLAGMAGIWLFYVQHQFEDSYYEQAENWDYVTAALRGSSFYKLPKVLQWMTGNIGFHHIHHLGPRVPNYNLQRIYDQISYLRDVSTVSLLSSLRSLRFRLWDEDRKKFIGFRSVVRLRSNITSEINQG